MARSAGVAGEHEGEHRDDEVAGREGEGRRPGPSSRARRRRSGRSRVRARRSSRRPGARSARPARRPPGVSSSGTAVTATPATRDAGAVGHQPGERADPQRVARLPVGAGVGEEPARDAEREADDEQGAGRSDAAEGRDQDQRAPVPGVGSRRSERSGREPRAAKSWPGHPRAGIGALRAPTPMCSTAPPRPYGGSVMKQPDEFDAFYKSARTRLLLQTYALTGDLPASRAAVRDSFVVAVAPLAQGEPACRPRVVGPPPRLGAGPAPPHGPDLAPRQAASTRRRPRTLESLGKLLGRRSARRCCSTELTTLPLADRARELGLTRAGGRAAAADRGRAVRRHCATSSPPRLPRAVRDAARAGRGLHLAPRLDPAPVRRRPAAYAHPGRGGGRVAPCSSAGLSSSTAAGPSPAPAGGPRRRPIRRRRAGGAAPQFDADALRRAPDEIGLAVDGTGWRATRTSDNTEGNGLATPCQQRRYADPRGRAALVRSFTTSPARGEPQVAAVQTPSCRRASRPPSRTWDQSLAWYAGCTAPAGPARDHPCASPTSATRRCSSSSATGARDAPTSPASPAPAGSPRRRSTAPMTTRARRAPGPPGCWSWPSTACARPRRAAPAPPPRAPRTSPRSRSARSPGCSRASTCRRSRRSDRPWVGTEAARGARQRRRHHLRPAPTSPPTRSATTSPGPS